MSETVKRSYSSPHRQAQARETRRSILASAGRLFVEAGYGATSLQQVADDAGVSVQTVYAAFGNKKAILEQVLDVAIAGDDESIAVNDRDWMAAVFTDPDPATRLNAYASAVAGIHERAGAVFEVLRAAADTDPDLAAFAATAEQRRRTGASSVIDGLIEVAEGSMHLERDRAVDVLWTLNSADLYGRLVRDCGWSLQDYTVWLAATLKCALLTD
jgi:AcrR family transcriptional regulator